MDWWIGVHRTDQDLDLRIHTCSFLFILRKYIDVYLHKGKGSTGKEDNIMIETYLTNNGECASPFTIQAHVFSVGLSKTNIVTILEELSYSKGISVYITRGETLISHVKESIQFTFFDQCRQFLPLFRTRINTRRVVSTSVKQNYAIFGDFLSWIQGK